MEVRERGMPEAVEQDLQSYFFSVIHSISDMPRDLTVASLCSLMLLHTSKLPVIMMCHSTCRLLYKPTARLKPSLGCLLCVPCDLRLDKWQLKKRSSQLWHQNCGIPFSVSFYHFCQRVKSVSSHLAFSFRSFFLLMF